MGCKLVEQCVHIAEDTAIVGDGCKDNRGGTERVCNDVGRMGEILGTMKNIHVLESDVTIKSALKDNQEAELDALADAIAASLQ